MSDTDYFSKGMIYLHRGDLKGALRFFELSLGQEDRDVKKRVAILGNLGNVYAGLGDKENARIHYQQVLNLHRENSIEAETVGQTLVNLGNLYREMGDIPRARAHYLEAEPIIERAEDLTSLGTLYSNMALLELDTGQLIEARNLFKKAIEHHKRTGNEEGLASTWGQLGRTYQKLGKDQNAETCFNYAFTHFGQLGNPFGEIEALRSLIGVYESRNEPALVDHCRRRIQEIQIRYGLPLTEEGNQ